MTTNTPNYERMALTELESVRAFRTALAAVYDTKPLDYALVGVLKAGIRYSLDTAQTYATLATIARQRDETAAKLTYEVV